MKHIAFVPARMGSEGFKFKNRKFFDITADFVDKADWFDRIIVSTDDPVISEYAQKRTYEVHERPEELAGPAISIHQVFDHVVPAMDIESDDVVWLFYLPVLFKNIKHFTKAKGIIESGSCDSLCTFVPVKTHPFNCWRTNEQTGKLEQYVENDCFRRQDLPPAWVHYHYVYCFRAGALDTLNSEMICADTHPYFLDEATRDKLIEIDTPEDYDRWKAAGCPMGGDNE